MTSANAHYVSAAAHFQMAEAIAFANMLRAVVSLSDRSATLSKQQIIGELATIAAHARRHALITGGG